MSQHESVSGNKIILRKNKSIVERFKMKSLAIVTAFSMILQLIYPTITYAVTAGPSSPEFSSFEPVATTNMVNEFTGQFIYNLPVLEIPGAAGGGYAISLAYHGGDGPENEASWVGFGWTLNPGSITRNRRGIPDDYKGDNIEYYNSAPKNWTIAATGNFGAEAFSVTGSVSQTLRYNYYKGFGITTGVSLSGLKGLLSIGYSNTDGAGSFSAGINPCALLSLVSDRQKTDQENASAQMGHQNNKLINAGSGQAALGVTGASSIMGSGISSYTHYLLASMTSPYNLTSYSGSSWEGYVSVTGDPAPAPIGLNAGINISYTSQQNLKEDIVPAFGYMYSGNGKTTNSNDEGGGRGMMDYTVENASTFNSRDKYMPVPSSTPDAYIVSGEGLSGGFRMYNDKIGIFSPNFVHNSTTTHNFGVDVHLGLDVGVGGDFTVDGFHTITVQSSWPGDHTGNGNTDSMWFAPFEYKDVTHTTSENMFFRFNNDLGGKVRYDSFDHPIYALIDGGKPMLQIDTTLEIQKDTAVQGQNRRSGRASYIAYHTNREINTFSGTRRPLAFEQRSDINSLAGRSDTLINWKLADQIGEVSVVNEGGNRYTYGLPVYTANETSLRRGLQTTSLAGADTDRYLKHSTLGNLDNGITIGDRLLAPYATQYLLTEITTPDYLDINGNGPDDADFGGYTKFSYDRFIGTNSKTDPGSFNQWYKWRTPYNGVMFAPNRLSDPTDDMGSYQSGFKEVYYLDTIQTKTHFAVFNTSLRTDGIEAYGDDDVAASVNVQGLKKPRKLDQIQLYSKPTILGGPNRLIKTIHFEYSYDCWPNNINSLAGPANGKLTLKKVWFEYNGVVNALISPYQFDYNYPTGTAYPAQYSYIQSEMTGGGAAMDTPKYTPYIDCWGNYMDDGYHRRQILKNWVNQVPSSSFDPAAWQLKRIILPSGGEIHVQYEQNSYSFVQNRNACALVSLLDDAGVVANGNSFTINAAEIGATTPAQKNALAALINTTYHDQKIFFKFFYTLKTTSVADIGNCNGDYLEGYVNFTNAYVDGITGQVKVQIDGVPRQLCKDYVHQQIGGRLFDGSCNSSVFPGDIGTGATSIGEELSSLVTTFADKVTSSIPGSGTICLRAKPQVSYLRIPVPKKLGGGIRVKRLMMYNKGIDVSSPALYGTEYIYENTQNGTSYGVATNEPFENKGENPLVNFMVKRDEQPDWDRLIGGRDKEQFEGPISWNILPSASIGYSRIIKQNIYQSQATTTGYTVIDYNTVKDYPFDCYYPYLGTPGVNQTPIQNVKDDWSIDFGILDYDIRTGMRSSQGYCFIQNQMHGQVRSISDYRGVYNAVKYNDITAPPIPVSQKTYAYFQPGQSIPMYDFKTWSIYNDFPGKESDITIDRRSVTEHSKETRVTGDVTTGFAFIPIFYPVAFPLTSESDQRMSSIVVNKVIHYPCIMKSMTVMKDGYVQKSEYVAFDPLTTKPVLTTTYDGFNNIPLPGDYNFPHKGIYTAFNVPASSSYLPMGQKGWNERAYYYKNSGITVSGSGSTYTIAGVNTTHTFIPGDLIALHYHIAGSTYDAVEIAHVKDTTSNITIMPTTKYNSLLTAGSTCYKVEIIQSGYTNQLSSSMDGVTTYGIYQSNDDVFALLLAYINQQIFIFEHSTLTDLIIPFPHEWSHAFYVQTLGFVDHIHLERAGGTTLLVHLLFPPNLDLGEQYSLPLYADSRMALILTTGGCPPGGLGLYSDRWVGLVDSAYADTNVNCKNFIGKVSQITRNIIKAQVTTYSDKWAYDTVAYGIDTTLPNHYESGLRGKWRPFETYVYNDSTVNGNKFDDLERNYNYSGTQLFDFGRWDTVVQIHPSKWVRSNHIDFYSPNGHATQEHDAENVYSAAKYGYKGILPYMVAQNAQSRAVHFESFENVYTTSVSVHTEEMMVVSPAAIVPQAHTGRYGYLRNPSESIVLPLTTDFTGRGVTLRFWAKVSGNPPSIFNVTASTGGTYTVNYVARSGAWALYEANWTPGLLTLPASTILTINNISGSSYVFDDIRIQPTNAKATCYVYDVATLKLSSVLDDQLFATYYQYNGEGKLVRTLVETIKGIKTVEESQYHVPLIPR